MSSQFIALASGQTAVLDTNGNDVTLASAISGSGATTVGTGTLTLTGANSYSGGTTLDAGTLSFADGSLVAGVVTFAGGTLQWGTRNTQNVSSQFAPIPAGQAALLNTGANRVTLASPISGSGSLAKTGSGRLILGGANTYGGGTTASAGILEPSPLASLPLGGGVTVQSGAALAVASAADLTTLLADSTSVTFDAGSYLGVDTTNGDISGSADIGTRTLTPGSITSAPER